MFQAAFPPDLGVNVAHTMIAISAGVNELLQGWNYTARSAIMAVGFADAAAWACTSGMPEHAANDEKRMELTGNL
jgi:hypothetical protein